MSAANAWRTSDRQGAGRRWGPGAQRPRSKAFAEKAQGELEQPMSAANAWRTSDRQRAGRRWGPGAQRPRSKAFAEKRTANWQNK